MQPRGQRMQASMQDIELELRALQRERQVQQTQAEQEAVESSQFAVGPSASSPSRGPCGGKAPPPTRSYAEALRSNTCSNTGDVALCGADTMVAVKSVPMGKAAAAPSIHLARAASSPVAGVGATEEQHRQGADERLLLPSRASAACLAQLQADLQIWAAKFGGAFSITGCELEIHLGAQDAEAASAELHGLIAYDLGEAARLAPTLPVRSGGRSAPSSAIGSDREPADPVSNPDTVFDLCDTDGNGTLDVHELRFALNAFGLFPSMDYLESWMDDRDHLSKPEFNELLQKKRASAPTSMRRPRAIPYARRGVSLQQLADLSETFVESGWISERCREHNAQHEAEIRSGKVFSMDATLYALDKWIVRPATTPDADAGPPLPEELRKRALLPQATHKCSYSELLNCNGVAVDNFVSHFWGHKFTDTMTCLQKWSRRTHQDYQKRRPEDMTFWLCVLALNQHFASEEVGSSPEEGPFNAALQQAKGAVMVLDDTVMPFKRIWCLFEVQRLTDLRKDFQLICSLGPVGRVIEDVAGDPDSERSRQITACVRQISDAIEKVGAFGAGASSEADKLAIWHRVADPVLRRMSLEKAKPKFNPRSFKRFDMNVRCLLAGSLFKASLQYKDHKAALRYIGMGAAFNGEDLDRIQQLSGLDLASVEVSVNSYNGDRVSWTLLHCAAYFGHREAVCSLVARRADLAVKTTYGYDALAHAARSGQKETVALLIRLHADPTTTICFQSAAYQGLADVCEVLLMHRADPNRKMCDKLTPLQHSAKGGVVELVRVLLQHGAALEAPPGTSGMTAVHYAAANDQADALAAMFELQPEKALQAANTANRSGATALALAEASNCHRAVDVLVDAQASRAPSSPTSPPQREQRSRFGSQLSVSALSSGGSTPMGTPMAGTHAQAWQDQRGRTSSLLSDGVPHKVPSIVCTPPVTPTGGSPAASPRPAIIKKKSTGRGKW